MAVCSAFGCASYSSHKEARTIDPGTFRLDVSAEALNARPRSGATAFFNGARPAPWDDTEMAGTRPTVEVQVRYGVASGFDLGLKTTLSSIELNGTVQLVRGPHFDLALAPAIQGAMGTSGDDEGWGMNTLKLPLLADLRFGSAGEHAVVFGPAVARAWGQGTGRNSPYSIGAVLVGGSIGLSLADGPNFRFIPEIAVYTTVAGHGVALPGYVVRVPPDVGGGQPTFIQAGIGFAFGRTQ